MLIMNIIKHIILRITKSDSQLQNYECDKDGLVPKFGNIGGKNERTKKEIESRKNR